MVKSNYNYKPMTKCARKMLLNKIQILGLKQVNGSQSNCANQPKETYNTKMLTSTGCWF